MIVNIHAYDRLGTDLVISVSALDDHGDSRSVAPCFRGRATIPSSGYDLGDVNDVLAVIAEELFNVLGTLIRTA